MCKKAKKKRVISCRQNRRIDNENIMNWEEQKEKNSYIYIQHLTSKYIAQTQRVTEEKKSDIIETK